MLIKSDVELDVWPFVNTEKVDVAGISDSAVGMVDECRQEYLLDVLAKQLDDGALSVHDVVDTASDGLQAVLTNAHLGVLD